MNTHQLRRVMWSVTVILVTGAAIAIAWAWKSPARVAVPTAARQNLEIRTDSQRPLPSLKELQLAFAVDLRRPLVDPPPPPAPVNAPVETLSLKLAGTVIEPGHCRAMLQWPDGKVALKRVGDEAGGATLLSIESGSATFLFQGHPVTLNVEKKKQG